MTIDKCDKRIKNKIIIINSDRRTLAARILKIAHALEKGGYNIEVLTWDRMCEANTNEYVNGIKVHNLRLKVPDYGLWVLPFYFFWWLYVAVYLTKNSAVGYHPLNLYNLLPTIPLKFIKKVKIIYDLTDFTADSFNFNCSVRYFMSKLENYCLNWVDGLIIVDSHRINQIDPNNIKHMSIIMNTPDDKYEKFKFIDRYYTFTIYCGGWISQTRGIGEICEAASQINGIELIIAGFGQAEIYYKKLYEKYKNIHFVGLLSKEDSLIQTHKSDLICAFYDPKIPINRLASPNKLFDAMMCGRPILSNSEAVPVAKVINEEKCGILIPYADIDQIVTAILQLKKDVALANYMGHNGRNAFLEKYDWSIMEKRLIDLYKNVYGGFS